MADTPEQWEQRIAEQEVRAEKFQRLHAEGMIEHELPSDSLAVWAWCRSGGAQHSSRDSGAFGQLWDIE